MELVVYGKPIAKKRPRFFRRGKYVGTYNDQEAEDGFFMIQIMKQLPKYPPDKILGPIYIAMEFGLPIPKSVSKKKRAEIISKPFCHIKKPDLDNLEKFVLDCLTRVGVWKDDSLIVSACSSKFYDENPFTRIIIDEVYK